MIGKSSARAATVVCGILCLGFACISWTAVAGKSATYDEPLHVATAWLNVWRADFRLSPDVPPLWEYWIGLPLGKQDLQLPAKPDKDGFDHAVIAAMYQTPPARGVELVNRSRAMSLPLAVALAILVACCAGELGGPVAAVAATVAFVFDPNWLGHGALAKNDVAFALVYFATFYAAWRVGQRASWGAIAAVVVLPAICLGTKMSGLAVGPVLAVVLGIRAMMKEEWIVGSRVDPHPNPLPEYRARGLKTRRSRVLFATGICLAAAVVAYAGLWAQYQFRFNAGPDGLTLDMDQMVRDLRDAEVRSRWQVNDPTPAQLAEWRPAWTTRAVCWMERHRVAPQAWAAGYIYTQTTARERNAYLMGHVYAGGNVLYFLAVFFMKEPMVLVFTLGAMRFRWSWRTAALGLPALIYMVAAMTGDVNIGIRHVFPVLAFLDVATGLGLAWLWTRRHGRLVVMILGVGLAAETLAAYPDFISFFNRFSGGERGGIRLLGDSNLDWGQDLPLLADWQKEHPNTPLYLDYFGTCDPAAYGIRYINVPGGYVYGPTPQTPDHPGVAAISATKLQGLFGIDPRYDFAAKFRGVRPVEVLGGTIYLFSYPP